MDAVILHLEDSDLDAELIALRLAKSDFVREIVRARDRDEYATALSNGRRFDLILSDYQLPTLNGHEALELARQLRPQTPFVFVSGALGEEIAVETLRQGAVDYVLKQRLERLAPAIERALVEAHERTELRRVEAELRQSDNRLRVVLEHMPVMMDAFDERGVIVAWNRECERVTGYSAAEIVGNSHAMELLYPDAVYRERMFRELKSRGHDYRDWEWNLTCKDGTQRTVAWSSISGRVPVPGWASWGVGLDVTDRKRADDALTEAARRKDEFLAVLAHELRNPLAPLSNGLHLLKMRGAEPQTGDEARAMMERQLTQLVRLTDDLLDVNRITRGKITLRLEKLDLVAVARQAAEANRPLMTARGHALRLELPEEPLFVSADSTRLLQIFVNLLNNAAKYTDRGGQVTVTVRRTDHSAEVRILDSGIGIPGEMLPRVFEMFTQVDGSLEKAQGGLGIGLSLVKGLVELHGGEVEAFSDGPGSGSEFVVRLPLFDPSADGHAAPQPVAAAASGRRKVLVVDDNHDAADSLAMMLRVMGHDVATAYDGRTALTLVEQQPPEIMLLDLGMPQLNGYEVCRRIRREPWGALVRIVALSGWGQEEDRRRSAEAGFDRHLVKPIALTDLQALLAG